MATQIERDNSTYTIEWDSDVSAVIHTWKEFVAGEAFKEGLRELGDVIKQHEARHFVVDASGIQALDEEDKEWLKNVWIPRMMEAGVKASVTIPQDSVIAKMDMEKIHTEVEEYGYESTMVASKAEAREWLSEQ